MDIRKEIIIMNDIVIVSFRKTSDKKKLEAYIHEKGGKTVDLNPYHKDGELSIHFISDDLEHISRTNITCAACFGGMKFKTADDFIKWHRELSNDSSNA